MGARQGGRREGAEDQQAPRRRQAEARDARLRRGEPKTVVTGATNIAPGQSGMKVILGLRGTRYFFTDKDGKKTVMTLEPKALRGIMNDAMCMSNFELGIVGRARRHHHSRRHRPRTRHAVAGRARRDRRRTRHPAEHGPLPVDDRHRPRGRGAHRRDRRTSPKPRLDTSSEKIDGKVKVEIADPKLCRPLHGDDHPQRDDRPGTAVDAARGCTTPACGRSTTSWTSPTT